jgi:hypothetical protein
MTQKLTELLNLPQLGDTDSTREESATLVAENRNIITQVDLAIDKIDAALPGVRDLETGDAELDELATMAKNRAEDLMDLGMNVDPRFAGVILQTASNMMGHAITAKTAKLDKKIKMVQLQLAKAKLDHQIAKDSNKETDDEEPVDGKGMVLDRNALLAQILASQKK